MHPKKALIVDNNAGSRELMRILMEHEGYQTVVTGDSMQAVELACSTAPDLILIDLHMPLHEGFTTARRLRQNGRFQKQIVAVTGREIDTDPEQISAAGFTAYISKPLVLQGLHERLAQIVTN